MDNKAPRKLILAHLICPKHDEIIAVKAITTCYDVAHMKGVLLSTAVWCASIPVALAAFLFPSPTLLAAGSTDDDRWRDSLPARLEQIH